MHKTKLMCQYLMYLTIKLLVVVLFGLDLLKLMCEIVMSMDWGSKATLIENKDLF